MTNPSPLDTLRACEALLTPSPAEIRTAEKRVWARLEDEFPELRPEPIWRVRSLSWLDGAAIVALMLLGSGVFYAVLLLLAMVAEGRR